MPRKSRRIRKGREDPLVKLAKTIVPEGQVIKGRFEFHDVSNYSEDDQRHMVRSGNRKTIRRKSKIDELIVRGVIDKREALACEWYLKMHTARYDTTGITANLGGAGGRSNVNFDHLPKTRAQWQAYEDFEFARAGINRFILPMFERVVLYGWPLGKLGITFRLAVRQLLERIEGRVQL